MPDETIRPEIDSFAQFEAVVKPLIKRVFKGAKRLPTHTMCDREVNLYDFVCNHDYFTDQMKRTETWDLVTTNIKNSKKVIAKTGAFPKTLEEEKNLNLAQSVLLRAQCLQIIFGLFKDDEESELINSCYEQLVVRQHSKPIYATLLGIVAFEKYKLTNEIDPKLLTTAQENGCCEAFAFELSRHTPNSFSQQPEPYRLEKLAPLYDCSSGFSLVILSRLDGSRNRYPPRAVLERAVRLGDRLAAYELLVFSIKQLTPFSNLKTIIYLKDLALKLNKNIPLTDGIMIEFGKCLLRASDVHHAEGLNILRELLADEDLEHKYLTSVLTFLADWYLAKNNKQSLLEAMIYFYRLHQVAPLDQATLTTIATAIDDEDDTEDESYTKYLYGLIQNAQSVVQAIELRAMNRMSSSPLLRFTIMNKWQPKEDRKRIIKEIAATEAHPDCAHFSFEGLNEFARLLKEIAADLANLDPRPSTQILRCLSLLPSNTPYRFYYYAECADYFYTHSIEEEINKYRMLNSDVDVCSEAFLTSIEYRLLKREALESCQPHWNALLGFKTEMVKNGIALDNQCGADYTTYVKLTLGRQKELYHVKQLLDGELVHTVRENKF